MAQKKQPLVNAKIDRMVNQEDSKIKAYASANIAGAFAIHGLKVIDSSKGLFVQMPQSVYTKDGEKKYSDIFHAITADGYIYKNVATGCKLPTQNRNGKQLVTSEEIKRILSEAKKIGYYELFVLELSTGLRRGEILGLQWDDIYLIKFLEIKLVRYDKAL